MEASLRSETVRPPSVAGTFYPADPARLSAVVDHYLGAAGTAARRADGPPPKALIVPHAGYVYSGPVAARAYAALAPLRGQIERVVLFGPAHHVWLRGLAVPHARAFETPLGSVPIDEPAVARVATLPQVVVDDRPHAPEHSLEVQLPFLQRALGHFRLVPFVVGDASDEEVAEVMERAWGGPETLIVVSSDLSHYHPSKVARRLDAATAAAIERLDPTGLGEESACGRVPVRGLLLAARRRGLAPRRLELCNSGDTAGDPDRVVGYGAWAFSEPADPVHPETDAARHAERGRESAGGGREAKADPERDAMILGLARRAVEHAVRTGTPLSLDWNRLPDFLREPGAAFVTLERSGRLRGCIGDLEARDALAQSIVRNAWAAALRDPRFPPVGPAELPGLHVKVSLIGPPRRLPVGSREELIRTLRPGRDGVILKEGGRRATLLPSVWQSLPDPAAFVRALEDKGGFPVEWSPDREVWVYETRDLV